MRTLRSRDSIPRTERPRVYTRGESASTHPGEARRRAAPPAREIVALVQLHHHAVPGALAGGETHEIHAGTRAAAVVATPVPVQALQPGFPPFATRQCPHLPAE